MNILDPRFRYVASHATDLRKTFARIRREAREQAAAKPSASKATVVAIERARKSAG